MQTFYLFVTFLAPIYRFCPCYILYLVMQKKNERAISGPYTFDTEVEFFCLVEEVKPSARIAWTLAGQQIEATHREHDITFLIY